MIQQKLSERTHISYHGVVVQKIEHSKVNKASNNSLPGVWNRDRGYTPTGLKNFENTPLRIWKKYTPPRRREAPPPFFGQNAKIYPNLTEFSLN